MALLNDELSLNEKAFLISIAPYVGYDNVLKLSNNKKIGAKDLVSISGLSRASVFRVLNSLDKKCIIKKIKEAKNTIYVVNPWVFHRGLYINDTLKDLFGNYLVRCKGNVPWNLW